MHSSTELELDDEGTRISLTIVDTPGFGDQIDNEARQVALAPNNTTLSARLTVLQLRGNCWIPRAPIR